jgi:hypothetical protein
VERGTPNAHGWKRPASSTDTPAGGPAVRAPQPPPRPPRTESATVAEIAEDFIAAAEEGSARNRTGRRYRPSALRDLAGCLRLYVLPELGDLRVRDVQPEDLQRLVDELAAGELSLSRIRSVVSAIRALYGYALDHELVAVSPADDLAIARTDELAWDDGVEDEPYDERFDEHPSPDRTTDGYGRVPSDVNERTLPELFLSFVLRLVVTVFVIVALAALAQALLLPA